MMRGVDGTKRLSSVASMTSAHYKQYCIEPYEEQHGRWRSRVRRRDGQMIKTAPDGRRLPFVAVKFESGSLEAAIAIAKVFIDRNIALGTIV
jgi:hypothetical protein